MLKTGFNAIWNNLKIGIFWDFLTKTGIDHSYICFNPLCIGLSLEQKFFHIKSSYVQWDSLNYDYWDASMYDYNQPSVFCCKL